MTLDDIDRHLITLLHSNAREPAANLARKLKIARTTVVARIARLERKGVVAGYGVRLAQRMERADVQAFCGINVDARGAPTVLRALERYPEVEEMWAVTGQFDYMLLLRCDSAEMLDKLLDHIRQFEGVSQTYTSLVLSCKIDRRSPVSDGVDSAYPALAARRSIPGAALPLPGR